MPRASGVPHALYGRKIHQRLGRIARRGREVVSTKIIQSDRATLSVVIARERACEECRPHPEELAKQASRRMDTTYGLTAILRDARKSALLRMKSEIYFTIAKAGDPVFRGVSYGNASLRGTGYSAFAEYDGVARSDLSVGAQRAKADATWQCCLSPPSSPTAHADGRSRGRRSPGRSRRCHGGWRGCG